MEYRGEGSSHRPADHNPEIAEQAVSALSRVRVLSFGLLLAACTGGGAREYGSLEGPWRSETGTTGDTVTVHTLSGSEWGTARLVEELRIGAVEGAPHEMFGGLGALAVSPDGDILIYDAQATVLHRYGADGSYLGALGGAGSGPGEYRSIAGLGVLPDRSVVLNDFGNGRFNIYAPDGSLRDTWFVRPAIAAMRPVHPHPAGGILLHDMRLVSSPATREEILVHLDANGVPRDTLVIPYVDRRPPGLVARTGDVTIGARLPFAAGPGWTVTAAGELAAVTGDSYAIDVFRDDGSVLRISRHVDPVPVSPEERSAEEGRITAFFERSAPGWRWDGPRIPETKAPVSWLHAGEDGTIWVRVAQPGSVIPEAERLRNARTFVREPTVFEVFERDGRFLGQVRAPDGMQLQPYPVLTREYVWAVVNDESDVSYVVRFRLQPG